MIFASSKSMLTSLDNVHLDCHSELSILACRFYFPTVNNRHVTLRATIAISNWKALSIMKSMMNTLRRTILGIGPPLVQKSPVSDDSIAILRCMNMSCSQSCLCRVPEPSLRPTRLIHQILQLSRCPAATQLYELLISG
jgi:hypothetical protein